VKRITDMTLAGVAWFCRRRHGGRRPPDPVDLARTRHFPPGPLRAQWPRFEFYKFRSMCENAEELKAAVAHLNQKQLAFKIPGDPRLTGVGRWLRKFSVDEWPNCGTC